jgi:cytochrome c oxidase subunit 2
MNQEYTPMTLKREHREIFLAWAVITIAGVLVGIYVIPWLMPQPASNTMHLVIITMQTFTIAAAPVAGLVYAVAFYALHHWRHPGTDEPPPDGPPLRGNTWVTGVWLVTSALLCTFLLVWGLAALAADDSGAASAKLTVDVTGQQWVWSFHYPGTDVSTPILYLPEGKTVTFDVTSKDVVHGFWIVQMGIKVDANPGVITTTSTTPDKLGTFDLRCAELCGLNHAFMVTTVHVVTPAQFQTWLHSQPASV